ncbi:Predicted dehydrogenase [Deinococcus reticulitermitis]|uniref:Predicted dehydrogenase n=1 Tax=Deinococcus reticulitermitis TaxID=856736 RepID=A0A1H6ZM01_9DEIO|nr:Gfo/Idh/MocA family oxidoreductase [Deinococcus reticulitermitis]SEJ53706.1 Predicted dehydrogenase [Deinococcus reticulitermitis]
MTPPRPVRLAMVGGGLDAFIGAVHRHAARLDGRYDLVAGALSSTPEKSRASGAALGLSPERVYGSWQELVQGERHRPDGAEVLSIVTPNHLHYPVALAAVQARYHVICDKPLVHTLEQAQALADAAQRAGTVFAVTYNYSGYPLIRQAREMVQTGQLGELRKVVVEYHQGWLATEQHSKQAVWRTDPRLSGPAGVLGDLGTHAEQLMRFVTGLEIDELIAELTHFLPGRALDDDATALLRFRNGARGVLTVSQIEIGRENDLRLSVFGTQGSLHWRQEDPNRLLWDRLDAPQQVLTRGGPGLGQAAASVTRLPSGHPEAFIEAFATLYTAVADDILAREQGQVRPPDYPTVREGLEGVKFVDRALKSAASGRWVKF